MIIRAREALRQARFNQAVAQDSTIATLDTAIAGVIAAGGTSYTGTNLTSTAIDYIRREGYEVSNVAGDPTKTKIDWSTPVDVGADF